MKRVFDSYVTEAYGQSLYQGADGEHSYYEVEEGEVCFRGNEQDYDVYFKAEGSEDWAYVDTIDENGGF